MKPTLLSLILTLTVALIPFAGICSQQEFETKPWKASWIAVPGTDPHGYGVYLFRKTFEVTKAEREMPVYVSGDNRYKLYVNGQLASWGPNRSDVTHWRYDIVDIAPYLVEGKNVVTARVWNDGGQLMAKSVISYRSGFILQGACPALRSLVSDKSWLCRVDESYRPLEAQMKPAPWTGAFELVDMRRSVADWNLAECDETLWTGAEVLSRGMARGKVGYGGPYGWMLEPSPLPPMEMNEERTLTVRESSGCKGAGLQWEVPAHSTARILLDNRVETNAFPTLTYSGGKDASIRLTYAESLYTDYPAKGNRDEVAGKQMIGASDSIISDGGERQTYTPMYYRTYRYLELFVRTGNEPLRIEDIYGTATGYPFRLNARLETDRDDLQKILQIGWRTARLCAVDTYSDCPYYEQMQYIGDTRIQALVSLYNSGDDRLMKNALTLYDNSRLPEGMMSSRYPTSVPQYITTYNLFYIAMLHDYMMYAADLDFVRDKLPGARQVLDFFRKHQQEDGSVTDLPWWNFTDWVSRWSMGVRKAGKDGCSALIDLQLLYAYQLMADLETKIGIPYYAEFYGSEAERLCQTIRQKYWDAGRGLYADVSEKTLFSQHSNALALLTGLSTGDEAKAIGQIILTDESLSQASIYFKFYVHAALVKAGLGNSYLDWLGVWHEYMDLGLTTWGETYQTDITRSDCHAWGASPNIEFFRTVLGIDSDAPAFGRVRIKPHLGTLKKIGGEMPHPRGTIRVSYDRRATIVLPDGVTGTFVWKGEETALRSGENIIEL